jgi:hypothetical protein
MHPLSYQRPKAAPTEGAIAQAEKIIEQLGAQGSLARRFARIEDVTAIWTPRPEAPATPTNGVFGHLTPKGKESAEQTLRVPPTVMTWAKFRDTVLLAAERIEIQVPNHGPYCVFVTAENPDAPPILQWDTEDRRNPVSWYFWSGGSSAHQFGLSEGTYYPVPAICLQPSMWNGGFEHQGRGVMFLVKGAKETRNTSIGLFPEILKGEFHGIRSVLEAYSQSRKLSGEDEQSASGLMYKDGGNWPNAVVRVWAEGRAISYKLDRWD